MESTSTSVLDDVAVRLQASRRRRSAAGVRLSLAGRPPGSDQVELACAMPATLRALLEVRGDTRVAPLAERTVPE